MKSGIFKGLAILWITFLVTCCSQGVWISAQNEDYGNSLIKPIQIREKNKCIDINVKYPSINSEIGTQVNNQIKSYTDNWIKETKDVLEDYKKHGYICNVGFELVSEYFVTRESEDLISFYTDYYQFTGGAHGITTRKAYVVDRKTGKPLNINELFKKGYDYKTIIDKEIRKQISKEKEKYFDEGKNFKGINNDVKFYIRGNNIVIYYSQYEIAPYASGLPEFNIPISMFNQNFIYDKI